MQDKLIFLGIGGFIAGTFVQSFFAFDFFSASFIVLLGAVIFICSKFSNAQSKIFTVITIFCLYFALGIARYELANIQNGSDVLDGLTGMKVNLVGFISDEPDKRENNVEYTVDLEQLNEGGKSLAVHSRALVTANFFPAYQYGDRVKISGTIQKPENFDSGNGREFDYRAYLAKEGIYYVFYQPKIEVLAHDQGNFVKKWLFEIKESFISNVENLIPEPESSLLGGLVVGAKQSLGKDWLDRFRTAGVIHIVVLSGYNITIVAEAIMKFFSFLPKFAGTGLGVVGIILFAIMTGGSATVVRASLMALLVILARVIHRDYDIKRALFLAGFVMVLQNPKILAFDPSFQLSFMSTLGLIYVAPVVKKYFKFVPERFGLQEIVASTVATQIFVLPLLLYMMGQISIVGLPVNILILSFIPATMFFGFVTGVTAFVWKLIALPFAYAAYGLLWYEMKIVETFSNLPFAALQVSYFPVWMMVAVYLVYGFWLFRAHHKKGISH